jgi:hypothetical protein
MFRSVSQSVFRSVSQVMTVSRASSKDKDMIQSSPSFSDIMFSG